jgi:hypothetical protein
VGKQELVISRADRTIIRELAKQVVSLAARPIESGKRKLWTVHYSLKETRPMIFCYPETAWYEVIPEVMKSLKAMTETKNKPMICFNEND